MATGELGVREMTLRAVVSGCLIGGVLAMANVYMGLKTGFNDSGNITGCIAGFAIMSAWRGRVAPTELNAVQNMVAMAALIGFTSGIGAAIPALALLGFQCSWGALALWAAGLGLFGMAVAFARRERLFALELPFPTSVAAVELIRTFERAAETGLAKGRTLAVAMLVGGGVTWFRDGRPAWLASVIGCPGRILGREAASLTLGLGVNPMMIGAGALLGVRIGVSLFGGSLVAFALAAPILLQRHIVANADYASLVAWLLWPGVGLMLSATLTSFVLDVVAVSHVRGGAQSTGRHVGAPMALVLGLFGLIIVVLVGRSTFGLGVVPALLALVLSVPLAEAAMRAYGETDISPIGAAGQALQIGAASTGARMPTANLPLGNIAAGVVSHATASILALKIGDRLGVSARRQLVAQLVGTAVGIATAVPAYFFILKAYGLGGAEIPAPGVMPWKAVAEASARGLTVMPAHAAAAALVALVVGVVLTVLDRFRRFKDRLPSPTALGMGMLVPQYYSSTILVGAIAAALLRRRAPGWSARSLEASASGLIVGESLVGVLAAALIAFGILKT
jgi:uncharacterized oligopeptide transporter (OPT) family protein